MKYLLLLITLSFNIFASSGDGVGNGGFGYNCKVDSINKEVTMTLDTAEKLTELYPISYFKEYQQARKFLMNELLESIEQAKSATGGTDRSFYVDTLKNIIKKEIDLGLVRELDIFNQAQFEKLDIALYRLLNQTYIYIHLKENSAPKNLTFDSGAITLPSSAELRSYGLSHCKMVQIAVYGYVDIGYVGRVLALRFHGHNLKSMDDFSLRALLWHEVIYQALGDDNSMNTRKIVAKIMSKIYPLKK